MRFKLQVSLICVALLCSYIDCDEQITCPENVHYPIDSLWNKSVMRPYDFKNQLCPVNCTSGKLLSPKSPCFFIKCFPCTCDRTGSCVIYDTCCTDESGDAKETQLMTSEEEKKKVMCLPSGHQGYLVVRSCPRHYRNSLVKNLCENSWQNVTRLTDTMTSVSDRMTGVAYYNKYCAMCNAVDQYESWQISVDCLNFYRVYKAMSGSDLLKLGMDSNSGCMIKVHPPDDHYLNCETMWFRNIIGTCNVTGLWKDYDPDVEYFCVHSFGKIKDRCILETLTYKNVFCAVCNSERLPLRLVDLENQFYPPFLPFSFLLSGENTVIDESLDHKCFNVKFTQCLKIECAGGKVYHNGRCLTSLSAVTGLAYQFNSILKYQYLINSNESSIYSPGFDISIILSRLEMWFIDVFKMWASEIQIFLTIDSTRVKNELHDCFQTNYSENFTDKQVKEPSIILERFFSQSIVYVAGFLLANESLARDDVENYFNNVLTSGVRSINLSDMSLVLSCISYSMPGEVSSCRKKNSYCFEHFFTWPASANKLLILIREMKGEFIVIHPTLVCPHVTFNQSDFGVEINEHEPWRRRVELYFEEFNISFTNENEMAISGDNELKICIDLLGSKLRQLKQIRRLNYVLLFQYVLSLSCIGLSMLCLLLIIITYLLFPVLRNVAGVHNICLTTSLLLSQGSLLASSHVTGPHALCTALGIATHFLWLNMFCWSVCCCYQMYSVFTSGGVLTSTAARYLRLLIAKRACVCLLLPAAVVAFVMIYDFVCSNGRRVGYGHQSCYLNSPKLVVVALVIPLTCAVVVNFYFFLSSAYEINKLRENQSNVFYKKQDRRLMCVYVKLSTMTGIFWTVAILSEFLDNEPLRFVSIILNGQQGLFIFLSYVCNKRILTLYVQWYGQLASKWTAETDITSTNDHYNH